MYELICDNMSVDENGHLNFAGQDTVELARKYGTPLYLFDENKIRENCRAYKAAFARHFPEGSTPLYAGKAAAFKAMYRIMNDEGMGIDVVSCGEIYTAKAAGYDLSKAYFHGNNKSTENIDFAIENGVGCIVVDSPEELLAVELSAAKHNTVQNILLRLTPGIDPHTYEAISTGKVDSKFGSAIDTGAADAITKLALDQPHVKLMGFHCHIGSQVFAEDVFERAAEVMLTFIAKIARKHFFRTQILNLGGGYGVRYNPGDPHLDIAEKTAQIAKAINDTCEKLKIDVPKILMEPGRSIVANAGMTLYKAGSVKKIPGYKTYISIDGGMTDNPRYALYKALHYVLPAQRMDEEGDMLCTLAGCCCESGDLIRENIMMPSTVKRGDIIAVCTTGAYNFSMFSNYNKVLRPAVVMLKDRDSYVGVKRQTYEDLIALEL